MGNWLWGPTGQVTAQACTAALLAQEPSGGVRPLCLGSAWHCSHRDDPSVARDVAQLRPSRARSPPLPLEAVEEAETLRGQSHSWVERSQVTLHDAAVILVISSEVWELQTRTVLRPRCHHTRERESDPSCVRRKRQRAGGSVPRVSPGSWLQARWPRAVFQLVETGRGWGGRP